MELNYFCERKPKPSDQEGQITATPRNIVCRIQERISVALEQGQFDSEAIINLFSTEHMQTGRKDKRKSDGILKHIRSFSSAKKRFQLELPTGADPESIEPGGATV